ncbi:uncharacterized protein UV8b_06994 [Ustilaginoidea virens]|uniref:Zn(2)-C6 fungal-type domain-containing protein n=1 Tax=Ustilaginoidea virens TaxID=1159556 RepID=A0A8E5HWC7_USTVR|nr:uncharacterized protein UV8b_06994 [Ustilaginoidea virens]QUC22753.1 hypothetical protein UV8b_06994 [Ustilaginoidea virens]
MDRRYVPLRPWSPGASAKAPAFRLAESKRRRVGVNVACNDCRRKKIRCDGGRPTCTNCQGKKTSCEYRDEEGHLSKESKDLVVHVTQSLSRLPHAEQTKVLHELRNEMDAWKILSVLRQGTASGSEQQLAESTGETPTTESDPAAPDEWESQNPVAYPDVENSDAEPFYFQPPAASLSPTEGQDAAAGTSVYVARLTLSAASSSPRFPRAEKPPPPQLTAGPMASDEPAGSHGPTPMPMPMPMPMPIQWQAALSGDRDAGPEGGKPSYPPGLCDDRLCGLDIHRWTSVAMDSQLAARCISLYLETDHPLLGHFDPELFVAQLVSGDTEHCSSLLVTALLYWACQMYSAIDPQTDELALKCCAEAEKLWRAERDAGADSTLTLAATAFLSLGHLGQGRDHSVLTYLVEAAEMAGRMGLFTFQGQRSGRSVQTHSNVYGAAKTPYMYAAWGIFNWLTLMSLFYHRPGMICPTSPPRIAIPRGDVPNAKETLFGLDAETVPWVPAYMGDTFPYLCWFWTIASETSRLYDGDDGQLPPTWGPDRALAFAEFKYRELLAWTNSLPLQLMSNHHTQHHVQVMHIWLHATILDLFRPFVRDRSRHDQRFRTFASSHCTARAVRETSTARLKKLMVNYSRNYGCSNFTILWHTALIYVANAVLDDEPKHQDWYSYLVFCLYGYERLSHSWRVAKAITKGLLSMTLRKGDMSAVAARRILADLESNWPSRAPLGGIEAPFMLDLNRALSEPGTASVDYLAGQLEDNILLGDYTNVFGDN